MELFTEISNKWELILAVIYIIYNEYKRYKNTNDNLLKDKILLIEQLAKENQKDFDEIKFNYYKEIERFTINKIKHFNNNIIIQYNNLDIIKLLAIDDLLIRTGLKIQDELMSHVLTNGYHDLNHTELEDYIIYISDIVFDIYQRKLLANDLGISVFDYIDRNEIIAYVRDIIQTSINIKNRLNNL